MANNRISLTERKTPFNLSIRRGIKDTFEAKCEEMALDKNLLVESLISGFLNSLK